MAGKALQPRQAVPAPGLLFGPYPQRDEEARRAPLSAWPVALPDLRARRRRAFIADARRWQRRFELLPAPEGAARLATLRALLARDGFEDNLLAQVFALIALACQRTLGIEPHDTQLLAARILLERRLAEMATGEGKTLAAGIAALAAALAGVPVHVVTANDYLAQRDCAKLRPLAEALGLSAGAVAGTMDVAARIRAYRCDICWCAARELAFDYLRDSLAVRRGGEAALLRGLCMAIVDEADSILIDEARVPLVLSEAAQASPREQAEFAHAWRLAQRLLPGVHHAGAAAPRLTRAGRALLAESARHEPPPWSAAQRGEDLVCAAILARDTLESGVHYHVRGGKVCLIDDTTGRSAEGRAWSGGLQQMVELKEGCALSPPAQTASRISYQRFFPRYLWLCGMSGTLAESRRELFQAYGMALVGVPLRGTSRRTLLPPAAFSDTATLWRAVARDAARLAASGRPVLIGTDSVADSEALSRVLSEAALAHAVLNARFDRHEAAVVAAAGMPGAITVATNMAGRGTDIALSPAAAASGGLHVICCQQNPSARIDRQLIGRCARAGQPGSAQRLVALDGRMLAGATLARWLRRSCDDNGAARGWRARLALMLLGFAQQRQARRERRQRRLLLRQEREMARWLSFSGRTE
ncbi:preprotein translocase subunit SecA [Noviherbaspirillum soli]|uniref:preprotein translocase subunit SecA n=1 Tax=Noviherbaspirillum soli TaxID=1064518 RepID=UPI00188B8F18|nr:DEAD/DEAH box helicase [Noviherbaspirillum soli]